MEGTVNTKNKIIFRENSFVKRSFLGVFLDFGLLNCQTVKLLGFQNNKAFKQFSGLTI